MITIACTTILAMGGSAGGPGQSQSPMVLIGWLAIMVGLFYFMMIRPQQRKEKERKALISNIKSGDRVLLSGGIIGVVANIKDNIFIVKIADNTRIEVIKSAILRVLQKDEDISSEAKG